MAQKKENSKGKKSIMALITPILVPILLVVLLASAFFTIVDGIIKIIEGVVRSIVTNIASFLSNPFKYVSSKWATFSNFLDKTIGIGKKFNENEYEDARKDLEAALVIDDTDFKNMKEALQGKVNQTATGLDDIMLKKMLLSYYRGLYLQDTNILMELSDEEKISEEEAYPFEIVKGNSDNGRGEDGKKYLQAKGMISIVKYNSDSKKNEPIIYYPSETLKEIYEKHYLSVVKDNEGYANSVLDYLERCYTYSSSGIQMYVANEDTKKETWKYENEGRTLKLSSSSLKNVKLTNIEFYEKVAQYATPVEFMVDLMEVTGSKDFINAFIETVGTKTSIEMELSEITYEESSEEVDERTRNTVISGKKEDINYEVKRSDGTTDGLIVNKEILSDEEKVKITVIDNKKAISIIDVYANANKLEYSSKEVSQTNNWTVIWELYNPDQTVKEKKDISKVIHKTTTTHKEKKYDLVITGADTWYYKMKLNNTTKDKRTIYTSITENNEEVEVPDENSVIKIVKKDEDNEYNSSQNPNIFNNNEEISYKTVEDCLNLQYKYIINIREDGYDPSSYTFTDMRSSDTEITMSTLKKVTIDTIGKGTQTVVDNTDLFLGLLSNEDGKYKVGAKFKAKSAGGKVVKYPDLYKGDTGAGELLINGAEMLFMLLEESKNTQGLSDVMRYILYLYSGIDYGVTSLDFNMFASKDFSSVGISGSTLLKEYIHTWEGKPPTNEDGTKYIIYNDGYGHATVGYGIDIINGGFKAVFQQAGYSISIGGKVDKDFVDSLEEQEINSNIQSIKSITSGLNLTEYQIHALVSRAYNCGISGATGIRDGKTFVQAYKSYWNQERDDLFKEKNSNANFNHKLYTTYMSKPVTADGAYSAGLERRRKSEWILFQTGYYNVIDKWYSKTGELVSAAYDVADHFINSGPTVHYAGNDVNGATNNGRHCIYGDIQGAWDKPISNPSTYGVVCATFVSLAIWKAGLIDETTINRYGYNSCTGVTTMLNAVGWEKIYSASELQPGDVVFQPGHVLIYVGDGKCIDQNYCVVTSEGNDYRGNEVSVPSSFTYGYRYVASN